MSIIINISLKIIVFREQNSDNSINITTTGWANVETYAAPDGKKFVNGMNKFCLILKDCTI